MVIKCSPHLGEEWISTVRISTTKKRKQIEVTELKSTVTDLPYVLEGFSHTLHEAKTRQVNARTGQ